MRLFKSKRQTDHLSLNFLYLWLIGLLFASFIFVALFFMSQESKIYLIPLCIFFLKYRLILVVTALTGEVLAAHFNGRWLFLRTTTGIMAFIWILIHNLPAQLPSQSKIKATSDESRKNLILENPFCFFEHRQILISPGKKTLWMRKTNAPKVLTIGSHQSGLLKTIFAKRIAQAPQRINLWLQGILLANKSHLDPLIKNSFKVTSLYHLLVLSGSHISLCFSILTKSAFFLLNISLVLHLLSPRLHFALLFVSSLFALFATFIYCCICGMEAPCQRAILAAGINGIFICLGVRSTLRFRLAAILFLQSIVFPIDFFSLSNLLSWLAYGILLGFRPLKEPWIVKAAITQGCFLLVSVIFFKQLSVIGFFANLLFTPLFDYFVLSGFVWIFLSSHVYFDKISNFILISHELFFELIIKICLFSKNYKFLYFILEFSWQGPIAVLLALVLGFIIYGLVRRHQKQSHLVNLLLLKS